MKNYETILPFSCCPLVLLLFLCWQALVCLSAWACEGCHVQKHDSRCLCNGTGVPKGPGRIKNTTTYSFTIAVLIHYLWRSPVDFPPGKQGVFSKVPEGHHPRGTTLREALRGNLPLRGLCGVSSRVLRGSLRGFCGALRGSAGVRGIFRGFSGGSDPMLVTLGNCWSFRDPAVVFYCRRIFCHRRSE